LIQPPQVERIALSDPSADKEHYDGFSVVVGDSHPYENNYS
jgi:hypothetical protein